MAPRRVSLCLAAGLGAPSGYEPEESKQYLREMERYGGKANGAYWLVAAPLPSDLEAAGPRESKRGG